MPAKTVKIPISTFTEVGVDEFRAACLEKHTPKDEPKFAIGDVAMLKAALGRDLPVTVIGVQSKSPTSPWFYEVAKPRWEDGVINCVGASEGSLTLISPVSERKESK